jgi:hypothetical protein
MWLSETIHMFTWFKLESPDRVKSGYRHVFEKHELLYLLVVVDNFLDLASPQKRIEALSRADDKHCSTIDVLPWHASIDFLLEKGYSKIIDQSKYLI